MKVSEFQTFMRKLYFEKDSERGMDKTLGWLSSEVRELIEAVRENDGRGVEEELADVIAWAFSLANLKGIDVEKALKLKYPNLCSYCQKNPCECEE